jgi:hypothetical protein
MADEETVRAGPEAYQSGLEGLRAPEGEFLLSQGIRLPASPMRRHSSLICALEQVRAGFEIAKLTDTPALHLLDAFGLIEIKDNPAVELLGTKDGPYDSHILSIRVNSPVDWENIPSQGLHLASYALIGGPSFDLVFNRAGMLSGIVAVPEAPSAAHAEILGRGHLAPDGAHQVFINLCPYYHRIPQPGDSKGRENWWNVIREVLVDSRAVNAHVAQVWKDYKIHNMVPSWPPAPWVALEVNRRTGERTGISFTPSDLASGWVNSSFEDKESPLVQQLNPGADEAHRAILPHFPTVFSPGLATPDEIAFHAACYNARMPGHGNKALIIGPGIGVEGWLMSQKGIAPDVVGINPFEVANMRASAQAAGFECRAVLGSNIIDSNGSPHLLDQSIYGVVAWNMPFVSQPGETSNTGLKFPVNTLGRFWDGDESCRELYKLARNISGLLHPQGTGIFWNHQGIEGHPPVREIFERAGSLSSTQQVFNVREEAFPYSDGRVFTVRHRN